LSYNRILAAIDALPSRSIVFEQALEAAQLHQAELKLLHCVEAEMDPMGPSVASGVGSPLDVGYLTPSAVEFQVAQKTWEAQIEKATQWLQDYCQNAAQQGIIATYEVILEEPGHQICDRAREWQIDLIVVGRQGHSGLTELLLGSVSNHVLHHAPCSVLIIQGENALS